MDRIPMNRMERTLFVNIMGSSRRWKAPGNESFCFFESTMLGRLSSSSLSLCMECLVDCSCGDGLCRRGGTVDRPLMEIR